MSFVVVVYWPPFSNNDFYITFNKLLKACYFKIEVIILHDLNCNWLDKTNRKSLKQITDSLDFTQLMEGPIITAAEQCRIRLWKVYNHVT